MKLATMKNGSRDGKLVVVSRDLTRFTDASFLAPSLQAALDDWQRISPHLATLAESLETGAVPSARFHEHEALAPLPRVYQHSGGADVFTAARDPIALPGGGPGVGVEAAIAAITGDLTSGVGPEEAREAVALLVLAATPAGDAGAVSAFSPVAVTPDELDAGWGGVVDLPLQVGVNNKPAGSSGKGSADFGQLVAAAAGRRRLGAGAVIVAAGVKTPFLSAGDTIRIEMKDRQGHSVFGAIEQTVQSGA